MAQAAVRGGVVRATRSPKPGKLHARLPEFGSRPSDELTAPAGIQPCRRRRGPICKSTGRPFPFRSPARWHRPRPRVRAAPSSPATGYSRSAARRSPGGPAAEVRSGPSWRSPRWAPSAQPPRARASFPATPRPPGPAGGGDFVAPNWATAPGSGSLPASAPPGVPLCQSSGPTLLAAGRTT